VLMVRHNRSVKDAVEFYACCDGLTDKRLSER